MNLHGFFAGETLFAASGSDATRLFNLCMREKIPYGKTAWDGEKFHLACAGKAAARLRQACERENIPLDELKSGGLPRWIFGLRGRFGLLGGLLLAVFLLLLSRQVVWNIRIEGNERLTDERILCLLAENGVEVGCPLRTIRTDTVEGRILLDEPDISWIALNVRGTTVRVEVRETERGREDDGGAANLVASFDGQIELIEAYDGNVVVKKGDIVRRGELLVSGVYDSPAGGRLRVTRASGAIYARTIHDFSVRIPLTYEKKVYTGRVWSQKKIKFFAKEIKVFANTGKATPTCDIIYMENLLDFFGGEPLPVGILTEKHREYTLETATLDPETAMEYALRQLSYQMSELSEKTELLEKKLSWEFLDGETVLNCRVVCLENIAVTQKIEIGS